MRTISFVWPALGTLLGLFVAAVLLWRPRWRVPAAAVLLCGEATLLLVAGAILIASSPNGYPPTHGVSALQRIVGTGRIATSDPKAIDCSLGIGPDANIFYGISELETYDPILPKAYFSLWTQQTNSSAGSPTYDLFCPNVTTLAQARGFGLSYVLVPHGDPAPPGSVKRSTIQVVNPHPGDPFVTPPGALDLYEIPGSSIATLSTGDGQVHPVRISSSNPARMTLGHGRMKPESYAFGSPTFPAGGRRLTESPSHSSLRRSTGWNYVFPPERIGSSLRIGHRCSLWGS